MIKKRQTKIASPDEMAEKVANGIRLPRTESVKNGNDPSNPRVLGRYPVLRLLGRGGMGEVYLAFDRQLEREVAVKVIRKEFSRDKFSLERFNREAKLAASIDHPNIVKVYDWGSDDTHGNFIVLEYIKGETLRDKLKRDGTLPVDTAIAIITDLAHALCSMNNKHIVHRDIKPGNILISDTDEIKLTDLGIAKNISNSPEKSLTRAGSPGTPDFMAPEQKQSREVDIRADIYSLGKTFLFLLVGKCGGDTTPLNESLDRLSSVRDRNESRKGQRTIKRCVPIIRKMVVNDRSQRYQSPEELHSDLLKLKKGRSKVSDRRSALFVLAIAAFIALLSGILWPYIGRQPSGSKNLVHSEPRAQTITVKETMMMIDEISKKVRDKRLSDHWTSSPFVIVVLPLRTGKSVPKAIESIVTGSTLANAIKARTELPVVDRESLAHVLREFDLEASDLTDPRGRIRLRQVLPASILIEPVLALNKSDVTLNVKIVNVETTEIVGFLERTITTDGADAMADLFSLIARRIIDVVREHFPIQGKITSVQGQEAETNIGVYHGLREGMSLSLFNAKQITAGHVTPGGDPVAEGTVIKAEKFRATVRFKDEDLENIRGGMLLTEKR